MLKDIDNIVSSDLLYRSLVILLGWLLSKLASNGLITTFILFYSLLFSLLQQYYSYLVNYSYRYWLVKCTDYIFRLSYYSIYDSNVTVEYLVQISSRVLGYLQLLK